MSTKHREEVINTFQNICQCSREIAQELLAATDWNEEAALEIFLDSNSGNQSLDPVGTVNTQPYEREPTHQSSERIFTSTSNDKELEDDLLQSALAESLALKSPEKSSETVPRRANHHKSIISSKIHTQNYDDEDSNDEDQAFYAGGSGSSGQQIIEPPKGENHDKQVRDVFESAPKQGATEDHDRASSSSSQPKKEKLFSGTGYSLGDDNIPSHNQGQSSSGASTATANRVEKVPIRFYSNGFTVGNGELRKFEENHEFLDYIKRGEIPPELRNRSTGGRQIEVHIEDHRDEDYKRTAPTFKPFGGTGHTVGLSESQEIPMKPPNHTTLTVSDADQLETLAEKRLKASLSSTTIRLRLPDFSTPLSIKIDLHRTLNDVRRFLNENVPSLRSDNFDFMEPPSTKIKREDEIKKISDTKLSNSTLIIRRIA